MSLDKVDITCEKIIFATYTETMTSHEIHIGQAQSMAHLKDSSIELVVTSPPYPMIEMWDDIMASQNPEIGVAIKNNEGLLAFELMHKELDKVWAEVCRVIVPGGFVCINIGDATRTLNGNFALYPNHSRIISYFVNNGFVNLPNILWRKQTNAPNKFMGSGMMPAGAYVTLEHEWILIFRKQGKRDFKSNADKLKRRQSSFFWEERNIWFSDLWDIKGVKQKIAKSETRERSAAYPFEIPFRLINMYSLQGDTVLDPFMGTGTTTLAAIVCNRNSVGYEIDGKFVDGMLENLNDFSISQMNDIISKRIQQHTAFIDNRNRENKEIKHKNENLHMPVITSQETEIQFTYVSDVKILDPLNIKVEYSDTIPSKPADIIIMDKRKKVQSDSQTALLFNM